MELSVDIEIDHLNILTENWGETVAFYHQLFGFIEGKHVPNGRENYLYGADGRHAWIHLSTLESKARRLADPNSPFQIQATPGSQNQNTGALDHVAWVVPSADFDVLLNKLNALKIEYRISKELPRQIWFFDPNGVKLEVADKL